MPKTPPPNSGNDTENDAETEPHQAERTIAEEFLSLWQEQIGLWLSDPNAPEQIQHIFRQFAHSPGFNAQFPLAGPITGVPLHGQSQSQASSSPTPSAAPSVSGEPNLRELIARITALETRITALEQRTRKPRRSVKKAT